MLPSADDDWTRNDISNSLNFWTWMPTIAETLRLDSAVRAHARSLEEQLKIIMMNRLDILRYTNDPFFNRQLNRRGTNGKEYNIKNQAQKWIEYFVYHGQLPQLRINPNESQLSRNTAPKSEYSGNCKRGSRSSHSSKMNCLTAIQF